METETETSLNLMLCGIFQFDLVAYIKEKSIIPGKIGLAMFNYITLMYSILCTYSHAIT